MKRKTRIIAAAGVVGALAVAGAGTALAVGSGSVLDDQESPITGPDLDRASAAALQHTGGGRVTDTEAGDEESYYEVEVTLDDGSQVDVQLDEQFRVVGDEVEGPEDEGDSDAG